MSSFSVSVVNVTETTIQLRAYFTADAAGYNGTRYVLFALNGTDNDTVAGVETSDLVTRFDHTFTGLDPGTEYEWGAVLGYMSTGETEITWLESVFDTGFETTLGSGGNVEPWSWTTSNGNASAAQTEMAYNVLMGTATTDNFSHLVWNDLVDKIAEALTYYGSWNTGGGSYYSKNNCKVSAGDTLSAKLYNSIRAQIDVMRGEETPEVNSGDRLFGAYIIAITSLLNEIISDINN